MQDKPARDTRAEILTVAAELFARHGYQRTSLREIADRLGLTKAAVLYHFPAKQDILGALTRPLLDDLDAALADIHGDDPAVTTWPAIEGMLDVLLAHRQAMRMVLYDLAPLAMDPAFHRFSDAMLKANRFVAGPDPDLAGQVRATQAIAMLGDPVILLADTPTAALRAEILGGVRRLLAQPPPAHRKAGRPTALSPDLLAKATRLYADGSNTIDEIAAAVGVSRATLYRHLR
ncbi:MAG TPA: TetR family transcriptional regulator [Pseudonocardiaceae bacterium]|nr:TetR family transcriptional regulator [Pseudonocardiaceae bacterium]